jgi:RNA polymerase sigma factor (sigma-70 family)
MKIVRLEEAEATRSFVAGEEKGFEYFFNTMYAHLLASAKWMLRKLADPEESAKDVIIDAFTATWNNRTMFSNFHVIKSYLNSCVRNGCLVELKRVKRLDRDIPDTHYAPFNETEDAEFYIMLLDALDRLPEKRREVIKMRYLQGKKVGQISSELRLNENTVKNHIANSLWSLREIFGITEDMIIAKRERFIRRVFFSCTANNARKGKLYGYSRQYISVIRNNGVYDGTFGR